VGFSQAFFVISSSDPSSPFGTFRSSLLNSFVFMLGNFDPSAFEGNVLHGFAVFLSCVYMLIVSILLLNLLIALMGDSYAEVKGKGMAQWKLEQANIITEMQGSMSEKDRECTSTVSRHEYNYFAKHYFVSFFCSFVKTYCV
jgi:transient receptor potential cation channel subfamily V member 6